jgi:hypothetical protein
MASGIKPYGHLAVGMSINPNDSTDFDITYKFQKLPASIFNPYFIKYTSFPLDRGSIDIKGSWRVRKDQIKSTNHLTIIDPRVGTRFKNKNSSWLPMRLIMFFVRERGNVIDYEVPITGNLKNPKFGLRDVIFDILENIFVKPATTPYRVKVKRVETEIEKSLSLKWEMRSSVLTLNQINFIQRMAHFLKMNPKVTIAINPQRYTLKEKEYIMFYEAKKKFYLKFRGKNIARFDKHDSTKIEQMSVKDPQFTKYLNDQTHDPLLFTVQDKCARLLSSNYIDQKYKELNRKRLAVVMLYFKEKGSEKQVKVKKGKSVIPFNGYSFYKIEYDGNFPPYLLRAFRQMCELNREAPREKFRRMINY